MGGGGRRRGEPASRLTRRGGPAAEYTTLIGMWATSPAGPTCHAVSAAPGEGGWKRVAATADTYFGLLVYPVRLVDGVGREVVVVPRHAHLRFGEPDRHAAVGRGPRV
ncbi:hypothetical protein ZWY2020_033294 [Hordeum vulgare]|nr:hypothetical protein ZWY2020_033294 [Hordeum vulgare]